MRAPPPITYIVDCDIDDVVDDVLAPLPVPLLPPPEVYGVVVLASNGLEVA